MAGELGLQMMKLVVDFEVLRLEDSVFCVDVDSGVSLLRIRRHDRLICCDRCGARLL